MVSVKNTLHYIEKKLFFQLWAYVNFRSNENTDKNLIPTRSLTDTYLLKEKYIYLNHSILARGEP